MSSKVSDLYRDGWHVYWDVNEPTLTFSGPGCFEHNWDSEDDPNWRSDELVMTMEEVLKLEKSIQEMKKYWEPWLKK